VTAVRYGGLQSGARRVTGQLGRRVQVSTVSSCALIWLARMRRSTAGGPHVPRVFFYILTISVKQIISTSTEPIFAKFSGLVEISK